MCNRLLAHNAPSPPTSSRLGSHQPRSRSPRYLLCPSPRRWWGNRGYFPKLIPQRDQPRWGLSRLPKCISEVGAIGPPPTTNPGELRTSAQDVKTTYSKRSSTHRSLCSTNPHSITFVSGPLHDDASATLFDDSTKL